MAFLRPLAPLVRLGRWPVDTQAGSRRNAMVAASALTADRAARVEADEFLLQLAGRRPVLEDDRSA